MFIQEILEFMDKYALNESDEFHVYDKSENELSFKLIQDEHGLAIQLN